MRPRQILVRLHLQQPATGTLELEFQSPAGVQILDRRLRRHDQLHTAIIELVDQVDETPRQVIRGRTHAFDVAEQYRVVFARNLDVIILRTRPVTQRAKLEPGDIITRLAYLDRTPLD